MDAEGENFGKVCDDFINGGMISEVELGGGFTEGTVLPWSPTGFTEGATHYYKFK